MSVYVDKPFTAVSRDPQARRAGARQGHRWCHMWADTIEELHAMASKLKLKPEWFQDHHVLAHYDLVYSRREEAIRFGAKEQDIKVFIRKGSSLLKYAFRRFKLKPEHILTEDQKEGNIDRAGGNVICEVCGLEYYDHPGLDGDQYHGVVVTCEWEVFKI